MFPSAVLLGLVGLTAASPFFSPVTGPFDVFGRDADISSGCSTSGTASCHNTSSVNTCCTESPGGLLLQTQVSLVRLLQSYFILIAYIVLGHRSFNWS